MVNGGKVPDEMLVRFPSHRIRLARNLRPICLKT